MADGNVNDAEGHERNASTSDAMANLKNFVIRYEMAHHEFIGNRHLSTYAYIRSIK